MRFLPPDSAVQLIRSVQRNYQWVQTLADRKRADRLVDRFLSEGTAP